MLVRTAMTNLKMTQKDDCARSACSPSPHTLSMRVLTLCLWGGQESAFGQMFATLPHI